LSIGSGCSGSDSRGSLGSRSHSRSGGCEQITRRAAVPVLLRVSEALTNSDGLVTKSKNSVKHVGSQDVRSLIVNIVSNDEVVVSCGLSSSNSSIEVVLRVLNECRRVVVVVI
jgi:hypothetical protein